MELVYTVCKDEKQAEEISRVLVDKGLAACTNYTDIKSVFIWDGLQKENETAMIIKTREENVPAVFEKVKELHTYDTPALFSIPVNFVEDEYHEWIYKETEPS